jgi:mannobiose 2-epimerase
MHDQMIDNRLIDFRDELLAHLRENILPYWERMEDPEGGYYGRRDADEQLHPESERGTILNARILWTLASAARVTGESRYREAADRQYRYFVNHFIDREQGGCYWSVNADGTPADTRKQFYAIAFAIYALSEYYRLTADKGALEEAIALFRVIELHSRDREKGGYIEAMTRDWQPIADMRLSEKDLNSSKTMNTHLHILEGYTNLLRVWPDAEIREATASLVRLFNEVIVDHTTWHMGLFFDDNLARVEEGISYGHDIEASWLMLESAEVIGDEELMARTLEVTGRLALAALEGRCDDGSMVYENHDTDRHWWVQAENVIGQLYLGRYHGKPEYYGKAIETWRYIDREIVDHEHGEWYWSRHADGSLNRRDDKAGFWKCPYHNSRMCLEAYRLLT